MDDNDLDVLAWTMLGEAGGEGKQGMADVGHVVLNRLNTGRYGSSLTDVALAPKQFSTWNSGAGGNDPKGKYPKDSREFQRARQLAAQVVAGEIPGPPGRPLDYHTPSVSPYWADSKSRNGSYTRNGHVMYPSVPVPPGELPEVATRQDTRRTPALPPVPVTSSPDMAMMRRAAAPSQLIRDSFAQLPRPAGNAGDSLAMSPVQGGRQQAPLFDAAFDERVGSMRQTRQPIDSQGMATGSSRPPAPVPASPFDRVTARMNALPPVTRLPEVPPPAVGGAPTTRSVQSVPMVAPGMRVSASDMARGRNGWETVASIPSTPPPTAFSASDMARGRGSVPPVIDRLGPSTPGLPALYGGFSPEQVAMIGVPALPEIPGAPRTRMASAAPFPMPRPNFMPSVGTALSVQPMPPMPMARPMRQPVAQQQRRAPVPMPLSMRPQQAPLRIVVQRDQPQRQQPAPAPVPQGFTSNGGGSLVSNEYGSTYYSRHL